MRNSFNHHNTSSKPRNEIVSIVHQSPQTNSLEPYDDEAYATFESSRSTYAEDRPLWINSLLTPWGLGSLLLILLANSLLSWAKWSDSYNTQTSTPPIARESAKIDTPHPSSSLSSPSTSVASSPSVKSILPPQTQPQKVNIPKPPRLSIATVKPKTDLTSALLPPSIQPQFVSVKTLPQPNSSTVLVKTPAAKPVVVQVPTSPQSSTIDPPNQRIIQGQAIEEMRPREEKQRLPLVQKVKAQKQAIQSRQNLNQVLNNMEPQPQVQQVPVPVQSQQPLQPQVIPNTLIIDGRNPENNTN